MIKFFHKLKTIWDITKLIFGAGDMLETLEKEFDRLDGQEEKTHDITFNVSNINGDLYYKSSNGLEFDKKEFIDIVNGYANDPKLSSINISYSLNGAKEDDELSIVPNIRTRVKYESLQEVYREIEEFMQEQLISKGNGAFASLHEIWGALDEEVMEYKEAVRANDFDEASMELMDITIITIFALAAIRQGIYDVGIVIKGGEE